MELPLRLDGHRLTPVAALYTHFTCAATEPGVEQRLRVRHTLAHAASLGRGHPRAVLNRSRDHALGLVVQRELYEGERNQEQDWKGDGGLHQGLSLVITLVSTGQQLEHRQAPMLWIFDRSC